MQLPEIDFSDLDYNEIGTWPLVLRIALIVLASVLAIIAVYVFALEPQIKELATQQKMLVDKRNDFKEKYNMAANLDAYKAQMVQMQSIYTEYLKELPATNNIPELIDNVTKLANADGVKIGSIKIGDPVAASGFYMELPISLIVNGTYNGIGKFVSDVEHLARIVTIQDFSIKPSTTKSSSQDSQDTAQNNAGILTMNIDTKTYWLASQSEQDAAKKGSKDTAPNIAPGAPTQPPTNTPSNPAAPAAPPGFVGVPSSPPGGPK